MNWRAARAALSHLREGNVRTLSRRAVERAADRVEEPPRAVADCPAPTWLSTAGPSSGSPGPAGPSSPDFRTYAVDDATYVNAAADADVAWTVDATDADAIEVPVVSPERATSVTVSTDAGDRTVRLDDTYDYPTQLWRTVPVPDGASTVELRVRAPERERDDGLARWLPEDDGVDRRPRVGLPAIRRETRLPPVVLVSIDTLPYAVREHVQPIVDALGPDAVVPEEPRTQGHWTPPSHATTFTGTYPGVHGYVGHGGREGSERPIRPDLVTLPQLLTDRGYKCSGLVSHTRILPEFGFGRGFHRFEADTMAYEDWVTREHDARASVDVVREWIDADARVRDHGLCYVVHLFDPHFPYLPPPAWLADEDVDYTAPTRYREQVDAARDEHHDYLTMYGGGHDVDRALAERMERYHERSVAFVAEQVARLVDALRAAGIFEEALVLVAGDHGEEFGERGFFTHASLYDRAIRPFVAIKPPAGADWAIPEAVDTVDVLPTVARLAGADVPAQCAGTPLQEASGDREPRVVERIGIERYSVAVEADGVKGIFNWTSEGPDRPDPETLASEPVLSEFYDLEAVRAGDHDEIEAPPNADRLLEHARAFAGGADAGGAAGRDAAIQPTQETASRLRNLGYR